MDAWHAARDKLSAAQSRYASRLAELRGLMPWELALAEREVIRDALAEGFHAGMRYAHEQPTIPPRVTGGEYSEQPDDEVTTVGRRHPKG